MTASLLSRIQSGTYEGDSFAVLYRPHHAGGEMIEVRTGWSTVHTTLEELPLPQSADDECIIVIPYCQLAERGYVCIDDGSALEMIEVVAREELLLQTAINTLPSDKIELDDGSFDLDDEAYAAVVQQVINDEIGTGAGSNFVLSRSFETHINEFSAHKALTIFRNLLVQERGAYWVFLVKIGDRYLVGASPEKHVSLSEGVVSMNPISGTYRYPETGPTLEGVNRTGFAGGSNF